MPFLGTRDSDFPGAKLYMCVLQNDNACREIVMRALYCVKCIVVR